MNVFSRSSRGAYNVLNHPVFAPNTTVTNAAFGVINTQANAAHAAVRRPNHF